MKEIKAYTVGVPNLAGTIRGTFRPRYLKDSKKLLNYVQKLDGFLGVHPAPPHGTLLIFRTENEAKRARNLLIHDLKLNEVANNICECYIPEEYARGNQQ